MYLDSQKRYTSLLLDLACLDAIACLDANSEFAQTCTAKYFRRNWKKRWKKWSSRIWSLWCRLMIFAFKLCSLSLLPPKRFVVIFVVGFVPLGHWEKYSGNFLPLFWTRLQPLILLVNHLVTKNQLPWSAEHHLLIRNKENHLSNKKNNRLSCNYGNQSFRSLLKGTNQVLKQPLKNTA